MLQIRYGNRRIVGSPGSGAGDQRAGIQMKSKIKSCQDLEVWQKAMDLVVIYAIR